MSRRLLSLVLVTACLMASILVVRGASAQTWRYQTHGQEAGFFFSRFVPNPNPPATPTPAPYPGSEASTQSYPAPGCGTSEWVYVYARKGVDTAYPSQDTRQSSLVVTVGAYDSCTWSYVYLLSGSTSELNPSNFKIDGALNKAQLETTITLNDLRSGAEQPVTLNLAWAGSGERSSGDYHYNFQNDWFTAVANANGSFRSANVSGAVAIGSQAPQSVSGSGWMGQSTRMSITVTHQ